MVILFFMIFVLGFVLLLGFLIYKKTYKTGFLKTNKKYILAKFFKEKVFFFNKLFLYNEESKVILRKWGKNIAKNFDNLLCKIRLNSPKEFLSLQEKSFFSQTLKKRPVYLLDSDKEFFIAELTFEFEDFYAVFFSDKAKKESVLLSNKVNFINFKNKKLYAYLQKLNINFALPKKIETLFYKEQFSFSKEFTKNIFLTKSYLLEKYQSQEIDFFVYKLFIGEGLTYVLVKNKTEFEVEIKFQYFYDLVKNKINYLEFVKRENFVLIKNLNDKENFYFNFSHSPEEMHTSALIETKKSNLPCLNLSYKLNLQSKQVENLFFMFSKNIQPLSFLNLKKLFKEAELKLDKMFCFEIDFLNEKENTFFKKVFLQAKIVLLQEVKISFRWYKESYEVLKQKFFKKEIDAFCFYLSLKNSLLKFNKTHIVINPHFFKFDFVISFKKEFQKIFVSKQNLKVPYLMLGGVKYYNHFAIPYTFLKSKSVKIQM